MSKQRIFAIIVIVLLLGSGLFVHRRYVLNSANLEQAINRDIPVGSTKHEVLNFVTARHPKLLDDSGNQVKIRFTGLAENMIYQEDIIVVFDFDSSGQLRSHSLKSHFTFF